MPMYFTDELVEQFCRLKGLPSDGTPHDRRERMAQYVEQIHHDYVEAWEIRTARPWNAMTAEEAEELVDRHPHLLRNPGVLSRLLRA